MAINHADGNLFISVFFYPWVALYAAVRAGAGAFAIVFFLIACPLGYYYVIWSRGLFYWILDSFLKVTTGKSFNESDPHETPTFWESWIVGPPLMLFYLFTPFLIVLAGITGIALGTVWVIAIARHVFF